MTTRHARRGWLVRLSITRRGGWRAWAAVSGDLERGLAAVASKTIIEPHIDAESRRGRDYVRVTLAMTVAVADVAEALADAWQAFQQAARDDAQGWDMTSAAAEVRPQKASDAAYQIAPSAPCPVNNAEVTGCISAAPATTATVASGCHRSVSCANDRD